MTKQRLKIRKKATVEIRRNPQLRFHSMIPKLYLIIMKNCWRYANISKRIIPNCYKLAIIQAGYLLSCYCSCTVPFILPDSFTNAGINGSKNLIRILEEEKLLFRIKSPACLSGSTSTNSSFLLYQYPLKRKTFKLVQFCYKKESNKEQGAKGWKLWHKWVIFGLRE